MIKKENDKKKSIYCSNKIPYMLTFMNEYKQKPIVGKIIITMT